MMVLDFGGGTSVVLRLDEGLGPTAGTELSMAREAVIYRALEGSGLPIPKLYGEGGQGTALLLELVPGSSDLFVLGDAERHKVAIAYLKALGRLHALDVDPERLSGLRKPAGPRDAALCELDCWESIFRQRVKEPHPLIEAAFRILRNAAPATDFRPRLCHGDVGPKNFMFENGIVSSLIDWEFAHLGDPMDDLASWLFRGQEWLTVGGSIEDQLAAWSEESGLPVDTGRLRYYRAINILRWYICGARRRYTSAGC